MRAFSFFNSSGLNVWWQQKGLPATLHLMLFGAMGVGVVRGGFVAVVGLGGAWLLGLAQGAGAEKPWSLRDRERGALGAVVGFLILAACLCALSPFQDRTWHAWLKVASILISLTFLFDKGLVRSAMQAAPRFWSLAPWVLMGGLLALDMSFLALYEHPPVDEGALTKLNRGATYGLMFLWPVWAALGQQKLHKRQIWSLIAIFGLLVLPALVMTHSRAGQVGFIAAILLFPIAYFSPRLLGWGLRCAIVASAGWPFAARALWDHAFSVVQKLPDSWRARVEIWDYLSYHLAARPLTGWGLGAVPQLSPAAPHGALYLFTKGPPAHAHNYITSLGIDLGVAGILVGVALALALLRAALSLERRLQPFALSAFIVGWGLALVAYDFWTDSLLAAFVLCGFWFAWLNQKEKRRD